MEIAGAKLANFARRAKIAVGVMVRIGVEHAIGRMKKFRIFADITRNNSQQNMIAKNIAALATSISNSPDNSKLPDLSSMKSAAY